MGQENEPYKPDPAYYRKITGVDPVTLMKAAYDLSSPRGLGFLHAREGGLSDEDAKKQITERGLCADYVYGRAIKLHVDRIDGDLFIRRSWYDHSEADMRELLRRVGITDEDREAA